MSLPGLSACRPPRRDIWQATPGRSALAASPGRCVNPGDRTLEAVVRLWKVGVITGQVSDEAGEPAIGVNVQAFRRADPGTPTAAYQGSGSARTDDRGIYRLATLPPGDYIIAVRQLHATVPTAMTDTMMQSLLGGVPAGAGPCSR